jgi:adenylate cyclase
VRTENLAILLTDITGYTARTSAQTREESRAYLQRHEAVVLPVLKGFGGQRRKNVGDAILATFPSPTNAVLAAMAVQDRLHEYNARVSEEHRLVLRAVLTLGEVRVESDDVHGEPVAIAGKVEKFANGGEIVFTEAVYLTMNKAEVPSREIGLRQLEGIPEPIRLFRVPREEGDGPPYGGKALAQLAKLSRVDEAWVEELSRDPKATLGRELSAIRKRQKSVKRWAGAALAPLAIAGVIWIWGASKSPLVEIEAAIDRGELERAKSQIASYLAKRPERGADGHYLRGRISIREKRIGQAAGSFRKAIEEDEAAYRRHPKIREAMVTALDDEDCSVRTEAAKTLGALGDPAARGALEEALVKEEERGGFLSGLFCKFSDHARKALQQLE